MSDIAERLPGRRLDGFDFAGKRFGDLLVVRFARTDGRNGRMWLCECLACGRLTERSGARIAYQARNGAVQSCAGCAQELRGGRHAHAEDRRRETYRQMWALYGTLYIDRWPAVEPSVQLDAAPLVAALAIADAGEGREAAQQQHGFPWAMFPVIEHPYGWACADCGKAFRRGHGCLECAQPVCRECVDGHSCSRATLRAIATDMEVTRERVRQIKDRALRKLRMEMYRARIDVSEDLTRCELDQIATAGLMSHRRRHLGRHPWEYREGTVDEASP